ncbi:quinone oxidoreductase family protein [Nocardioides acrostichi]|uniref:Zinc-binding alcohol dehydrogenase family protein n=1 Tax=Nocardioides acrostichi TaxID=2784339 RepID=A0A930V061_9ACTN|nr:zinc-binding alcohol dehydrogenase family protein [Nocardioides acrostichi]MBF4161609.1 zinc-binding alcohol dehydrogenase family protein [Nocardioides acrostichi]
MKAAVVTTWGEAPRHTDAAEPVAGRGEEVVEVLASAVSPRVRSQAAGSHYTSTDELPLIPGIDGVGKLANGKLIYFLLPDTNKGAMAERTAVDMRRTVPLPRGADAVKIAALMNPAMASWVALRQRITFRRGQSVLILGATGNAGRAAIQVAKRLGASQIVAVGRGADSMNDLTRLGATRVIELAGDPGEVKRNLAGAGESVDVVVDLVWGEPTRDALHAIIPNRASDEQELTWIQIGSVAGLESPIPSAALRAVNLQIIGSGQGSVPHHRYRREIGVLAKEILKGTFDDSGKAEEVALKDVETAWADTSSTKRLVIVNP